MSTNMDKLNIINKGKIKHKPLNLNNRQEENKENMNGQNGHLQVNPNERQQEQLVIKKIKMKTQNKVLQDKIRLMKEEIKKKMNMLQDAKQQTKRAK